MKTIADIVMEKPEFKRLNSILHRNLFHNKMLIFNNVSFSLAVKKQLNEEPITMIYVINNANQKGIKQIQSELDSIKIMEVTEFPIFKEIIPLLKLPSTIQRMILRILPLISKRKNYSNYGSIGFSNLGKSSITSFFPVSPKTMIFGIGGIRAKNSVSNGVLMEKHVITINLTFNHFIVDGDICKSFLEELKNRIEF